MIPAKVPLSYTSRNWEAIELYVPANTPAGTRVYFQRPSARNGRAVQRILMDAYTEWADPTWIPFQQASMATFVDTAGNVLLEGVGLVRLTGYTNVAARFPFSVADLSIDWERSYIRSFQVNPRPFLLKFYVDYEPATR